MPSKIKIILLFILFIGVAVLTYFLYPKKGSPTISLQNKGEKIAPVVREYKIGFITDVHGRIKGVKKKKPDLNSEAKNTLTSFSQRMQNIFQPDFIIEGGDLIEGTDREGQKSIDDFKMLNGYFEKMKIPTYHAIGNHETRGFSKKDWLDLTGNKETFYFFDYEDLRIIVMDGNENERVDMNGRNAGNYYLSDSQFEWLEKILSKSGNFRKIVFSHYPISETPGTKMINPDQSAKLREIFSKNKVSAVFSGHTELLDFKEMDGVRYFVVPGAERSKLKHVLWLESFSEIFVGKDVKLNLFYKKSSGQDNHQELLIPSEEYEKIEK